MKNGDRQARRRLAALGVTVIDGGLSSGYRSGRKRCRDTPVSFSIAMTRSDGARPDAIQPEIEPCDLSPRRRARADCPPAASQASNSAPSTGDGSLAEIADCFVLTPPFNAQTVNAVNAHSANLTRNMLGMGRQPESEPSAFWKRLVAAWAARNLPTTQNGIAKRLNMSQGSVRRWFAGEGFPETDTLIKIASLGRVSIDWLLTGKHHASGVDKDLDDLLDIWDHLDGQAREHVVRSARGEAAISTGTTRQRASSG